MTCATCKYWAKPKGPGLGFCQLITDYSDTISTDSTLAYTAGSYTDESGLYTRATFGCVLFSRRSEPDTDWEYYQFEPNTECRYKDGKMELRKTAPLDPALVNIATILAEAGARHIQKLWDEQEKERRPGGGLDAVQNTVVASSQDPFECSF